MKDILDEESRKALINYRIQRAYNSTLLTVSYLFFCK